jgi:nitrite reductase/ring-hydroxylating ferredoxin subunit
VRTSTLTPEEASTGSIHFEPVPIETVEQTDLAYHQLCHADEFQDVEGKPFHVNGTHLAVFKYQDKFYAVDNRCPHMGYPMSKGSIRDGVLICHWHHWEFDLKSGGCFLAFGDDLKAFPVELRDDGYLYVGLAKGEREAAKRRVIDRGKRALERGLKDRSTFFIAKAVTALRDAGAAPSEIIHQGLHYGAHKSSEGWSSGVAILTLAANLWDDVDPKDHNLFLVHGLSQISRRTTGSSRPYRAPFPTMSEEHDLETLKRWFRYFVDKRHSGAAERVLLTLNDRGYDKSVIADFVFTAATDYYFTGDGHAIDFANKMFEALDYVEWEGAHEILRPIVVDLVSRTRHEETSRWADAVPVLEPVFERLDSIWKDNQANEAKIDISAFTQTLLGDDFEPTVAVVEEKLRAGVDPRDICRAMTYASAVRTARFHLKNEGDWHDVANIYSYAHALYHAFGQAPSAHLLRGIFHGVVFLAYLRWLNMPAARIPRHGQRIPDETYDSPDKMLERIQEFADFQKVYEAEILVNQYLEEGHDIAPLKRALAHILLREDAELHMFQVLEVAFRHYELSVDAEEQRMHLLAATRYITAQKLMKNILWSTENAERLARGELLSERDDD